MDIRRLFLIVAASLTLSISSAWAQVLGAPIKDTPKDYPAFVISPAEIMTITLSATGQGEPRVVGMPVQLSRDGDILPDEHQPKKRTVLSVSIGTRRSLDWQSFLMDHEKQPIAVQLCGTTIFAGKVPPILKLENTSTFHIEFANLAEAAAFLQKLAAAK